MIPGPGPVADRSWVSGGIRRAAGGGLWHSGVVEAEYRDVANLLWQRRYGTLSTLSRRYDGWPFGSITPYALDRTMAPLILIASIAEHTKNITADPRVSLLVHETGEGDVQAHGRVTVLGEARVVSAEDRADAEARYMARLPQAKGYFQTHDFALYRIEPKAVRFIGGFGRIHWLEAAPLMTLPDPLAPGAKGILAHMNADHGDALRLYCQAFKGTTVEVARMVGVDTYGFDVETEGPSHRFRFDFPAPATGESIRKVMVELVGAARAKVATPSDASGR